VGTLTADAPGSAYYQFQAAAVAANRSGNVDVSKAGTVTVSNQGVVRRTPQVQSVRFLAGMEPRGHQENAKYKDVDLNIHCTNAP
jgi:bifunctional ADP-heptose synthase (sugar kinase/adenylyltransferase)